MKPALPALAVALTLAPLAARAGTSACWFEAGVLVVPAEVMGVAGDYVLDTGAAHTLIADTQAQGAGYAETALTGRVRVAGLELPDGPVSVAKLDARLRNLPTPVAGVIGADVLAGHVLDVSFSPCRLGLYAPGRAPAVRGGLVLPLTRLADGRPAVAAAAADGRRATAGDFVPATGSDTPVRLREDLADAPGAAMRDGLFPYGALRPRLRALSFAGELVENAPAGLLTREAAGAAAGEIGAPVLARYRLRFDFARGRLRLAKAKGPPDRSDGP